MRIPDRDLPHRVKLEARKTVAPSSGSKYLPARENVYALVVAANEQVVDERPEATPGSVVQARTIVRLRKEDYVPPGSQVTVHAGTPGEDVGTVVNAHYNAHPIAPESARLYLV